MRDFNHSVNVLVKAYLNDTLVNGHPCGCAVGNLIADSYGLKVEAWFDEYDELYLAKWDNSENDGFAWFTLIHPLRLGRESNDELGREQISKTGYSECEVYRIEKAFEQFDGYYELSKDDIMFKGLMAVVDVLAEIHNIDLTTKDNAKALFVKS